MSHIEEAVQVGRRTAHTEVLDWFFGTHLASWMDLAGLKKEAQSVATLTAVQLHQLVAELARRPPPRPLGTYEVEELRDIVSQSGRDAATRFLADIEETLKIELERRPMRRSFFGQQSAAERRLREMLQKI